MSLSQELSEVPADAVSLDFDLVRFNCPNCKRPGIIVAAWLRLTQIGLEGTCPDCHIRSVRMFDLLEIDRWLQDPVEGAELER